MTSDIPPSTSFVAIILYIAFLPFALALIIFINQYYSDAVNTFFKETRNTFFVFIAIIFSVLLFITIVCFTIHPVDGFNNPPVDTSSIDTKVRALVKRSDDYIKAAVGTKGMVESAGEMVETSENKAYVAEAQKEARKKAGGILDDVDVSGNHLDILERTLRNYTGPILLTNFDTSMNVKEFPDCPKVLIPCADAGTLLLPPTADKRYLLWTNPKEDRLKAITEAVTCQESLILKPMDDNVARLQRGQLLACESSGSMSYMKTGS